MGGGGACVLKLEIHTYSGVRGMLPRKILETLKCLGLHFARFHCGEREKDNVVDGIKSQSPAFDLSKIQHMAQNNGLL